MYRYGFQATTTHSPQIVHDTKLSTFFSMYFFLSPHLTGKVHTFANVEDYFREHNIVDYIRAIILPERYIFVFISIKLIKTNGSS